MKDIACLIDVIIRKGEYPNIGKILKFLNHNLENNVSKSTLEKDLKELRDPDNFFKMPLKFNPIKGGFYYTDEDYILHHEDLLQEIKLLKEQLKTAGHDRLNNYE